MMKPILFASLLFAAAGSGLAMADEDCHVSMTQWQPREAVQKMAQARGWQVSRIKIDDGCYQVRGVDETGQAFKARIDPATLSVVRMKRKDRHDEDDTRERRQSSGPGMTDASGAPAPNRLFETGGSPQTVVK